MRLKPVGSMAAILQGLVKGLLLGLCCIGSACVMAQNTAPAGDVVSQGGRAISAESPMVRQPIPGKTMTAAFMVLKNHTDSDETLTSASARWAGRIELHTHKHENGVMKMRQVDSIKVPANGSVTLQPGGLHLMIFDVQQPLPATVGGELPLELCFSKSGCLSYQAKLVDLRNMVMPGKEGHHQPMAM